jgi:hypothetical protein
MVRKWLSEILYSVEKAKFERLLKEAVKARKERLEDKNGLLVEMRPEFAAAFQNCMSFSCKSIRILIKVFSGERSGFELDEVRLQEKADQG